MLISGTPWWSHLENPTIDDKFAKKRVRLFIHQMYLKRVEKEKLLGRHNNYICKITVYFLLKYAEADTRGVL